MDEIVIVIVGGLLIGLFTAVPAMLSRAAAGRPVLPQFGSQKEALGCLIAIGVLLFLIWFVSTWA